MIERDGVAEVLRDMQEYRDLSERIRAMFGDAATLKDVVDSLERKVREPEKPDPVNARILTYEESDMWDAYRAIGTPEKCREAVERTRWIPVSERMPEDEKEVLVWFEYFQYGYYNRLYQTYGFGYAENGEWSHFVNGTSGWKDLNIIAWMPLPEPYYIAEERKKVGDSE